MSSDLLMKERVQRANDVYDSIVSMNQQFLSHMGKTKKRWIFSRYLFTALYLLNKITRFEDEVAKLLLVMDETRGFQETHDLVCEFNDLLMDFKPTFINYMNLSKLCPVENPEDLFNIYTYGGKV